MFRRGKIILLSPHQKHVGGATAHPEIPQSPPMFARKFDVFLQENQSSFAGKFKDFCRKIWKIFVQKVDNFYRKI